MSVWIANDYRFPEPRLRVRHLNNPGRDEGGPGFPETLRGFVHAHPREFGLPVDEVVGPFLRWIRPTITRRQVLKKLDTWTRRGPQRGDVEARTENVVQMLLFDAVIFAFSGYG